MVSEQLSSLGLPEKLSRFKQLLTSTWFRNGDSLSRLYSGTRALKFESKNKVSLLLRSNLFTSDLSPPTVSSPSFPTPAEGWSALSPAHHQEQLHGRQQTGSYRHAVARQLVQRGAGTAFQGSPGEDRTAGYGTGTHSTGWLIPISFPLHMQGPFHFVRCCVTAGVTSQLQRSSGLPWERGM